MTEPIRILHVLGALNRGGAETMIMNLYHNIDRSKIQFDFVIHTTDECHYNNEISELGGRIYNVPRYNGKNHFTYKKAWDIFFSNHSEYKIVHGHMRSTAAIYLGIAKKHGSITIAHSHSIASRGNKIEQIVKNIMQLPIRYTADYLFACSDEAGKWLFGKKSIRKVNYRVIKNAIDVEKYTFNEVKRNDMRKALGIEEKFVVGHVGSFTCPKNHKFLIDVFYQVQKQNKNAILMFVGDGELKPQIEKQINSLGIKDKVILIGVVSNVNDYMQAMDVFVFPSLFEGLGMAVIEAQVSGLKCIVSDNLPDDAFVTDLIKSLSLENHINDWKNKILQYNKSYERIKSYNEINCYKYNIKENCVILEKLYLNMIGENLDV